MKQKPTHRLNLDLWHKKSESAWAGQGESGLCGEAGRGMEMDREICEHKPVRRVNDRGLQCVRREAWEKVRRGLKKDN